MHKARCSNCVANYKYNHYYRDTHHHPWCVRWLLSRQHSYYVSPFVSLFPLLLQQTTYSGRFSFKQASSVNIAETLSIPISCESQLSESPKPCGSFILAPFTRAAECGHKWKERSSNIFPSRRRVRPSKRSKCYLTLYFFTLCVI